MLKKMLFPCIALVMLVASSLPATAGEGEAMCNTYICRDGGPYSNLCSMPDAQTGPLTHCRYNSNESNCSWEWC